MLQVDYIAPDGNLIEAFEMADGMTLEQAARTICPDSCGKFPVPTMAWVGSRPAVKKYGDWNVKLSGAKVQFRQLVMGGGGGGSNPLQMIMQVALIAAAVAVSAGVAGLVGGAAATGWLGLTGATWGALAGAGVMMLGTMLMGALFQQKLPSSQLGGMNAEQASPTYSINATGNQARLNQQEPEGFGEIRCVPDFVAKTWTQYINNDQIGYFVYGLGRGRYSVKSLSFGETVFWKDGEFTDSAYKNAGLEIEFVEPGNPVTLFPDNVITSEEVSGQELFAPNEESFAGAVGPYTTNPPGTKTNKLLLDFTFPQGVGKYNDKNEIVNITISWKIDYCTIDDFGNITSEWATLDTPSITMATMTQQRLTKIYNVAEGRYMVRVVRTSNTILSGTAIFDNMSWSGMKAMLPGTYEYPISCIAIAINASNSLTQNASRQFSAVVTRKLPLYDRATKTWSEEVPTRSWAAAISHVCKCEWGGRITDANIDLDTLWAIDERLQDKGWYYDSYIDGPTLVWTLLCEMCQSQCVIPRLLGPILSFVEDMPDRAPSFALTPRNIVRSTFGITYMTWDDSTPDDVVIEYLDRDYGYQTRDVTAKLPESESREPSSLDILGITDRSHAHKVAVAYAAHNRWQRIVVECQVEALGRIINKGDICTVAHPRFKNTCSGAIEWWNEGNLLVKIKKDFSWPEGSGLENGIKETDNKEWYISFMRQNGSIWGPCKIGSMTGNRIYLDAGDYSTLLLQGQGNPFEFFTAGRDRQATTWTLYKAKEYQRLMVVDSITSQDLWHYNLKLLNYDSRIYQYDDLPVPIWQGRGQLPNESDITIPQNFRGIVNSETSVTLTWMTIPAAQWYEVEISDNNENWRNLGRININQTTVTVNPGKIYARVKGVSETMVGGWAIWSGDTTLLPPNKPDVSLQGSYTGGEAIVKWTSVSGATQYAVSLRSGDNVFYTAITENTQFEITPEIQEGGPFRNIVCQVYSIGEGGSSEPATLNLNDPAPPAINNADYSISGNTVTLNSVTPAPTGDFAGYVMVKGKNASFTMGQVIEMRQTDSLPYTWGDLSSGTHYFRIAVKDDFFEITNNPYQLNWSAVLTVEIS